MQNAPSNLSPHQNSASLAALLVGSEAGTTDAGTPDLNNNYNSIDTAHGGRERYKRGREKGGFASGGGGEGKGEGKGDDPVGRPWGRFGGFADKSGGDDDDDPVGRPWGRFDSGSGSDSKMIREGGDEGGNGIGPLRIHVKSPDRVRGRV